MSPIQLTVQPALVTPEIDVTPAAKELRAALARENRQRKELAEESGVSAPLVTALLNATEKSKRMSLHNIGLIAASIGYRVVLSVEPIGAAKEEAQAA